MERDLATLVFLLIVAAALLGAWTGFDEWLVAVTGSKV